MDGAHDGHKALLDAEDGQLETASRPNRARRWVRRRTRTRSDGEGEGRYHALGIGMPLLALFALLWIGILSSGTQPADDLKGGGTGTVQHAARKPSVDTGYARYAGNFTPPYCAAFLGVPYAEPPLGTRRFRAPLPLDTARVARESGYRPSRNSYLRARHEGYDDDEDESGTVDASAYPDFCIQSTCMGGGDAGGAGSEDCLNLNIYTPVNATKDSTRESPSACLSERTY